MFKLNSSIISYERGRRLLQLLFCLFLAFVIWTVHNLSDDYSHLFQYTVVAKSAMSGKSLDSKSVNKLILRARASGFYILKHRYNRVDASLTLTPDNKLFKQIPGSKDKYYLLTSQIRAQISEVTADKLELEYISTDTLFFEFPQVVSKEVPVSFRARFSFRDQYMQTGELKFDPLTVTIYGEQTTLDKVDSVSTQLVVIEKINSAVNGVIGLVSIPGAKLYPEEVLYSIGVERYIEKELLLPVKMINLPEGYSVYLNPSQIRLTYRFPFRNTGSFSVQSTALYVNYKSINGASDTILTPTLENLPSEITSYTLYPHYIECKVFANTKTNK